jgi:hypothetical protein
MNRFSKPFARSVERNETLSNFNRAWMARLLNDYAVSHQRLRAQPLWDKVTERTS